MFMAIFGLLAYIDYFTHQWLKSTAWKNFELHQNFKKVVLYSNNFYLIFWYSLWFSVTKLIFFILIIKKENICIFLNIYTSGMCPVEATRIRKSEIGIFMIRKNSEVGNRNSILVIKLTKKMEISELFSVKKNNKEFKNKNLKFIIIINNWHIVA
jgi:hypothetical protein